MGLLRDGEGSERVQSERVIAMSGRLAAQRDPDWNRKGTTNFFETCQCLL